MLDLGTVRPGSTIYIPVNTFSSDDPSASVTATDWANTDCHVHKDGGTTQRASSSGETLSLNFDSITGNHLLEIDLADNTTASFYEAGSIYHVRIEGVTVDGATINAWIAQFRIGYPGALLDTTIATLASQVSFTLTAGSGDNDAYNGCPVVVHDIASAVQVCIGYVSDYVGSSNTVTLAADPGIFTMAAGDNISIMQPSNMAAVGGSVANVSGLSSAGANYSATRGLAGTALPAAAADAAGGLPISDAGGLDIDAEFAKLGTPIDFGSGTSTLAANLQDMADNGTATFDRSTDSLQALRDHVGDGTNLTEAGGDGDHLTEAGGTGDHLTAIQLPSNGLANVTAWTVAITGNITGNLSGSVGSVTGNVGGTVAELGTQAKADVNAEVDSAIETYKLDHLVLNAESDDPADNSIMAKLASADGDWSNFAASTDSLQAIRDHIGDGTNLTEAGGTGDQLTALATAAALATLDGIVDNLYAGIILGAAATGTLSTTQATTNLTGYADDQLIGRIVTWLDGNCEGESTDITNYENTNGRLTFTALTTAPSDGDNFKIT